MAGIPPDFKNILIRSIGAARGPEEFTHTTRPAAGITFPLVQTEVIT